MPVRGVNQDAGSEHLLVDGYNIIKADPLLRRREQIGLKAGRDALQQALISYARRSGARITLYFDGDEGLDLAPVSSRQDPVQVLFSRSPEKADDLIKRDIQGKHGAKRLRVITSDREIRRFAQRHKIRSTPAAEFAAELIRRSPSHADLEPLQTPREVDPDLALDEREIEVWEKLFEEGREKAADDE